MRAITALLLFTAAASGFVADSRHKNWDFPENSRIYNKNGRVIDGQPAVNGQFPHHAFVLRHSLLGTAACGGSLIDARWVVTAAHCLQDVLVASVYLGDITYANSPVMIGSSQILMHENYDAYYLNNDVGLIQLSRTVEQTDLIKVIPIVRDKGIDFVDAKLTLSGFGATTNGGSVSPTLNYVSLRAISNPECAGTYGIITIIDSSICAVGYDNSEQGSCNSDSGSPLIIEDNGEQKLVGVVSFGHRDGCSSSYPNGFVRISHFADWIDEKISL